MTPENRIPELDAARGICILGMVAVHFVYDLTELYPVLQWEYPPFFLFLKNWGAVAFFLISGMAATLGRRHLRRGLVVFGCGLLVSAAMKLTGADIISRIGICDISEKALARWEQELNQIAIPSDPGTLPLVYPTAAEDLFDCDVFVFCASRGVPDVSETNVDVRMVQLEKNLELVRFYADAAVNANYDGEFFVVSDPVDPLCRGALAAGLRPNRIQGFGLGVMNGRAAYYARLAENTTIVRYLTEGRVFGPHGEDLVVANSVVDYDEEASLELTRRTVEANLRIRELGFKPYIAPAVTSGALSILENLRGNWHYSSAWFGDYTAPDQPTGRDYTAPDQPTDRDFADLEGVGKGGAFLGMRNRRCEDGLLVEDLPLDDRLFARIKRAYRNLENLE